MDFAGKSLIIQGNPFDISSLAHRRNVTLEAAFRNVGGHCFADSENKDKFDVHYFFKAARDALGHSLGLNPLPSDQTYFADGKIFEDDLNTTGATEATLAHISNAYTHVFTELNRQRDIKIRGILNNCLYSFKFDNPIEVIEKGDGCKDYKTICKIIVHTAENKENLLKMKVKNIRKSLIRDFKQTFSRLFYMKREDIMTDIEFNKNTKSNYRRVLQKPIKSG